MVNILSNSLRDDIPLFQQIAEMIETSIAEDNLTADEKVPSTNELAKYYQINPATAAKGINLLVDQGIIYKKRGVGMFVTKEAKDIILSKKKENFFKDFVKPMLEEAERIDFNKKTIIHWIEEESE